MEKDSRDRTILIVEDSDDARYFMRLALEDLGYLIVEAENGAKAVEMAKAERPDIILMDLSLPIMDGIKATEKIRGTDGLGSIPVMAVTAHQETDFREGAKAAGFNAYVTKPIDIDFLSDLIKGCSLRSIVQRPKSTSKVRKSIEMNFRPQSRGQ